MKRTAILLVVLGLPLTGNGNDLIITPAQEIATNEFIPAEYGFPTQHILATGPTIRWVNDLDGSVPDKEVSWERHACKICGKTVWEKKIKHKNTQADLRRVEDQLKEYTEQVKKLQKQLEDLRRKLPREPNYVEASVNLAGRR